MTNTVGDMPGIVVLFSWNSMGDIIYIGYDVINIVDVMSYLYGCDIIKCSCDAMHTECDVIHIVCTVIQRVGVIQLIHMVWWHRYSGFMVRYREWDGRYDFCVVMCDVSLASTSDISLCQTSLANHLLVGSTWEFHGPCTPFAWIKDLAFTQTCPSKSSS